MNASFVDKLQVQAYNAFSAASSTLMSPISINIFAVIGAISVTVLSVKLLSFLWLFARPSSIHRYIQPDSYALITGATAGIGRAIAPVLLDEGSNIILHGRNLDKLRKLQGEMQSRFPNRKTLILVASALDPSAAVPTIEKFIKDNDLCVTILVNNVGGTGPEMFDFPHFNAFHETPPDVIDRMVTLNAIFPTQLARTLIPLLGRTSSSETQRRSLILTLGSYTGAAGIPMVTAYAGAKGFNHSWSKALAWELELLKLPVDSMGIVVGAVVSQGNPDPVSLATPSSSTFARAIVDRVGCGRRLIIAHFWQAAQVALFENLPEWLQGRILKKEMWRRHIEERRELQKKQ